MFRRTPCGPAFPSTSRFFFVITPCFAQETYCASGSRGAGQSANHARRMQRRPCRPRRRRTPPPGPPAPRSRSASISPRSTRPPTPAPTSTSTPAATGTNTTPSPPTRSRWGRFNELADRNDYLLYVDLKAAADAPKPPLQNKYGDFFAACMDTDLADKLAPSPSSPNSPPSPP